MMAKTSARLTKAAKREMLEKAFAKLRETIEKDPRLVKIRKTLRELEETAVRFVKDRRRQLRSTANTEVEEWSQVDVVVSPDERVSIRYGEGELLEFRFADVIPESRPLVEKLVYANYRMAEMIQDTLLLALSDIEMDKKRAEGRAKQLKKSAEKRAKLIKEAEKLRDTNTRRSKSEIAQLLSERGFGTKEAIRKKLK